MGSKHEDSAHVEVSHVPPKNYVYGQILAPRGMRPVFKSIQSLVGSEHAHIRISGYDGTPILWVSTEWCELESTPLENSKEHLLNGAIAGSTEAVVEFVTALSRSLAAAGIDHRFEVYDESDQQAFTIQVP
jgi:hypothetical protein